MKVGTSAGSSDPARVSQKKAITRNAMKYAAASSPTPNARALNTTFAAPAIFTSPVQNPMITIWNRTRLETARPLPENDERDIGKLSLSDARLRLDPCQTQQLRMRVAIVHYWLLGMRGGEKVLEALCRLAPEADIFTL